MTAIETDGGGSSEQDLPRKKLSGKKIVLFVVLPILILAGGGAAVYFSGLLDKFLGKEKVEGEQVVEEEVEYTGPPKFLPLEEILVNLNTTERKPQFLKLSITLELRQPLDEQPVLNLMPRIVDTFQVYLRELRPEDLKGSAGLYRLHEELLMRVNAATHPVKVKDVLIREFIVQ